MTESFTPINAAVDLTNCDREPIHKLGRVQSYGALIAYLQMLGTLVDLDAYRQDEDLR